ncbi:MAG: nucleotidyltransferase family protein [Prevotella sp.]|nr:nucleotidyltransferase family protein [Prevotella sp.]MBP3843994.1 nucleotidyltransferase family protein [Prevotella sp.]
MKSNNESVFFEFLRAGLWGANDNQNHNDNLFDGVDWSEVYRLAEEQSVVGLVTAGLDSLNVPIPQEWRLQFIGATLQIEQRNKAMNEFVAKLITLLRKNDIYALLVKGQGIAQCYEKPLWRASGDVDLFLSDTNYEKAKKELIPIATSVEKEYLLIKHLGMTIDGFSVELHGTLRSRLTKRIDREIDKVQDECFLQGEVRSWQNGRTQVFLPGPNQDVIFVFTHILHHLFIEGIGLRQICDWCRLLYCYRDKLDLRGLESRIRRMGLMSEWKAFFTLATKYLGMPEEVSGFMFFDERSDKVDDQDSSFSKWERKADRLLDFILETGNFGHNRMVQEVQGSNSSKFKRNLSTLCRRTSDAFKMMRIFPVDAWKMYFGMIRTGLILKAE